MSVVTNFVLAIEHLDDESAADERIQSLNKWLESNGQPPLVCLNEHPEATSGTKHLEVDLFIGAHNHFDTSGFIECIESLDWGTDTYQLMVNEEDETNFRIRSCG